MLGSAARTVCTVSSTFCWACRSATPALSGRFFGSGFVAA